MNKPTQAEVAELVGRLRVNTWHSDGGKLRAKAADALEALAGEGAEPTWDGNPDTAAEQAAKAGCAKPAGELPPLPEAFTAKLVKLMTDEHPLFTADQMRAYALRALRERA